eukprot:4870408-Prymnesium_polylepis.1
MRAGQSAARGASRRCACEDGTGSLVGWGGRSTRMRLSSEVVAGDGMVVCRVVGTYREYTSTGLARMASCVTS